MNIEELGTKVKDLFSRGTQASREALERAGDKVQDFTDKSVTKIEIQMLLEGASITSSNAEDIKILNDIQEEIKNLGEQIKLKEAEL